MPRAVKRDQRDKPGQLLLVADAERHCLGCGRRLRTAASAARQYGRRCYRRKQLAKEGSQA